MPSATLARAAAASPGASVLKWDGCTLAFRELDQAATRWADRFRAAGVAPGSVIALSAPPGPEAVAALFGAWRGGYAAAPLHERLAEPELEHALRLLRPACRVDASGALDPVPAGASDPLRVGASPVASRDAWEDAASRRGACVFLLTSGSSGSPKAVGVAPDAFAASAAGARRRLDLRPDDCWGLCLSLGHVGGLALMLRAVAVGCAVRCWSSFDADSVASAVTSGDVTHLSLVPVMLRRVLDSLRGREPSRRLRCVLVGGAAASPDLIERAVNAGLPVAPTWGMTETTSQVATAPPPLARRLPGTAGRPLPGVEVKVVGGVLAVRGPTLASVVVRTPEAGPEPLPVDDDGWFRTADTGRVDGAGCVWIEGRADAAIVTGGLNVAPREVEKVIESMPGVAEAVVFGTPDEEWGEVVAAVVEADRSVVDPEGVHSHCRARLSRGRWPSRIQVVDSLPRTHTGKTLRRVARERFGAA